MVGILGVSGVRWAEATQRRNYPYLFNIAHVLYMVHTTTPLSGTSRIMGVLQGAKVNLHTMNGICASKVPVSNPPHLTHPPKRDIILTSELPRNYQPSKLVPWCF